MTNDSRAFAAWPESMPKIDTGLANVARAWKPPGRAGHARALLTSDPAGVTSNIDTEARDPDTFV